MRRAQNRRDGIDLRLGNVGRGERNARAHARSALWHSRASRSFRKRRRLLDEQTIERDRCQHARDCLRGGSVAVGILHAGKTLRNAGSSARSMRCRIAPASAGASITLRARSRPCWRMPTFTTGSANEAASMMPLEELPTSASAWPSRLQ